MNRFRPIIITLFGVTVIALLNVVGCARPVTLRPAPGATDAEWMAQAAVSQVEDVKIIAQGDAWNGDPDIVQYTTPVRVVIENGSTQPVRLRYQEFALIAADGTRYGALPPYGIEGEVTERVTVRHSGPVYEPLFVHRGFRVASYTSPVYPRLTAYGGNFMYDPYYYDHYHDYWVDYDLPTRNMLRSALPEGVIDPGGRIEGFLYFERVDDEHAQVRFRSDVVNAETGDMMGEVSIPFVVE